MEGGGGVMSAGQNRAIFCLPPFPSLFISSLPRNFHSHTEESGRSRGQRNLEQTKVEQVDDLRQQVHMIQFLVDSCTLEPEIASKLK